MRSDDGSAKRRGHRGFSLVEVLVALVVSTVGLLGVAGLQSRAQQAELESYQRSQALILLQDMVNRINANRETAGCYAITDALSGAPSLGTGNATAFNCTAYGTAATQAVANADLAAWDAALKGAAETTGGSNVGAMSGARGCISYDVAGDTYTVAVAWQGLVDTVAPADACGSGQYGSEAKRRVVTATVRIADLT